MNEDKNFMTPVIPRFDGHYDHWSLLMENLLRSKGYWSLVETGYAEPTIGVESTEVQKKELEDLMMKDLKNECPLWDNEVNYAEFDEEEEILLMSYVDLPQNHVEKEEAWFLDSGCSNHMCGDKSKFSKMDEVFGHSVKLGNNTKMNVLGKGNRRKKHASTLSHKMRKINSGVEAQTTNKLYKRT
ncbi:Retrovirus-related Pol polyprotein from transposon TNT 1-94 [Sesbania bispinosa]|nr:Retrovirus-related Pol polyprotein from transposon TNT 1-94 [Sesbania bispinosa]